MTPKFAKAVAEQTMQKARNAFTGTDRAPEHDTAARESNDEQLIGLLLLRQAVLTKSPDHPHAPVFKRSLEQAKAELLWRLKIQHEQKQK